MIYGFNAQKMCNKSWPGTENFVSLKKKKKKSHPRPCQKHFICGDKLFFCAVRGTQLEGEKGEGWKGDK